MRWPGRDPDRETAETVRRLAAGNESRSGSFLVIAWYGADGALWLAPLGTPVPERGEPMPAPWVRVDLADRPVRLREESER